MKEVEEGRFREDLFYRLNVIGINIPPLRERREDIPLLVDFFIKKFNRELNKNVSGVSHQVMQMFLTYQWKGNVRELENAIERAMILCDGDQIMPEHMPQNFSTTEVQPVVKSGLKEAVMAFEKSQILKTLEIVNGDKKAAAKLLGLSISSLYRKMSELGLDVKETIGKNS
ncbi:MAG: helix-turn-helix domain-containing protein [candidate division KSB1 bacterium]|nr:helix-turn-helix domain-containing protein [candidate division KSB1 bacterium]